MVGWSRFAVVLLAVTALAGCDKPVGRATAELPSSSPSPSSPVAGACYAAYSAASIATVRKAVSCSEQHSVESAHVGTFVNAAAEPRPPAVGDPARRGAYQDCGRAASAHLGGDWRSGQVNLTVTVPTVDEWSAGARWYRCDLMLHRGSEKFGSMVAEPIGESFRDGLSTTGRYQLGCAFFGDADEMWTTPCVRGHNAEFVGVYDALNLVYPDQKQRLDLQIAGCYPLIASFLGVADGGELRRRVRWFAGDFGSDAWLMGNHGIVCFVATGADTTRSLKGTGLPGR